MTKKFEDPLLAMNAISEIRHRSKDVTIENFVVTVRTLGAKDETDTFIECMNLWGQAFIYQHKIETLCRSITHVNKMSLDKMGISEKKQIISSWHQELIDELYLEYAKLLSSLDSFFKNIEITAQTNVIGVKDAEAKREAMNIKTDVKES
jgi:hypothetical protein